MEKVDSDRRLYTRMRLWEHPDQYVIEPADGPFDSFLAISRVDGSLNMIGELPQCGSTPAPKMRTIYGLVGMLRLLAGAYMVVITERECVGSYLGYPMFKVSNLQIFPCNHALKISTAEQKKMETEFAVLLNAAERTSGLYFSYDVNLTLNMQRLHDLGDESKALPLWKQANPRFFWNNYMLEVLIDNKLDPYLLPVIQGSFQNFQATVGKNIADVTLIARRCTRRTGKVLKPCSFSHSYNKRVLGGRLGTTRMWRRGADSDGYVANFVETEQILFCNGFSASFLQVRGSIPLLWEQIVDLTYKPKFEVVNPEEAPRVIQCHFLDLGKRYGSVLAVDLHGSEGRLSQIFANLMQNIVNESIRYVQLDFHQICGHIHFERLSILYDQISDYLMKHRYCLLNAKGGKLDEQLGLVRTNCIDCLDRTNVTQSMIGRKMLENQLQRIGVFSDDESIHKYPSFDEGFKIMWANHGDEISIQYSGTPALKGDFVRYGKRTIQGIFNDGRNALARYYLNNFCDGTKQDAIDLLHGHYIVAVNRDMTSSLQGGGFEALASFPLASALVLAGVMLATMSLRQARNDARHLLLSVVWAGVSLSIMAFVKANGRLFCNRPRLHKPRQ
ncbi:hypothetical protein AMTRI_Chr09g14310 [Amborella trichopoda]